MSNYIDLKKNKKNNISFKYIIQLSLPFLNLLSCWTNNSFSKDKPK